MGMNVMEALKKGTWVLKDKNIPVPRLEAEMLMAHVLKCQRHDLYLAADRELDNTQTQQYFILVEKRSSGYPIQYIISRRSSWALTFMWTKGF